MLGKFAIAMVSLLTLSACAAQPKPVATEAEVLATAKQMSARECDPKQQSQVNKFLGCTYWAAFIQSQWWVTRVYDFEYKGQRTHASGGSIFIFSPAGKFIKVVGGM